MHQFLVELPGVLWLLYDKCYAMKDKGMNELSYRSGMVNSNTVNSKLHLIRSFFEIFARFLLFHA